MRGNNLFILPKNIIHNNSGMKDYIEILIENITEEQSEILIALLENIGFSGFETDESNLKAYIDKSDFNEIALNELSQTSRFTYSINEIKEQNWNALWESNFDPVTVDNFVTIRAAFHQLTKDAEHEILITPKMSFGTGHHATTYMMMQQMRKLNFTDKTVLDFGTGTGVLAIFAEKLGAKKIIGIDNDDWSIENAKENLSVNNTKKINIIKANNASTSLSFDIVLANINRNIIEENAANLNNALAASEGYLLLSGLLSTDEAEIIDLFTGFDLIHISTLHKMQWISVLLKR